MAAGVREDVSAVVFLWARVVAGTRVLCSLACIVVVAV